MDPLLDAYAAARDQACTQQPEAGAQQTEVAPAQG